MHLWVRIGLLPGEKSNKMFLEHAHAACAWVMSYHMRHVQKPDGMTLRNILGVTHKARDEEYIV